MPNRAVTLISLVGPTLMWTRMSPRAEDTNSVDDVEIILLNGETIRRKDTGAGGVGRATIPGNTVEILAPITVAAHQDHLVSIKLFFCTL